GKARVERLAAVERGLQLLVDVLGESFLLHRLVEDVGAEGGVLGQGQIERAQRLTIGAPLCCGHVLLADSAHRLCCPSLNGASGSRSRSISFEKSLDRAKRA